MQADAGSAAVRRAFTLVEMLVVIAIIGVLVALLIPTVGAVMARARNATIANEVQQLASALEAYKQFANDYPPDFTNAAAVTAHMTKAFPRNTRNVAAWLNPSPVPPAPERNPANLDAAEALVFWLSLLSTNPRDPLSGASVTYAGERKELFDFDETRLIDIDGDGWPEYVPAAAREAPYVYFDGRLVGGVYAYTTAVYPKQTSTQPAPVSGQVVRPYRSNTPVNATRDQGRTQPVNVPTATPPQHNLTEWMKPGGFQIISAGLDSEYGVDYVVSNEVVFKSFPTPNYDMTLGDDDNIASFSEMKTLADAVP